MNKPVYIAGQGFSDLDQPPSPRRWFLWIGLVSGFALLSALGLWLLWSPAADRTLQVESTPAGGEIWINLQPTTLRTPGRVTVPGNAAALIQVRLADHEAEPLARHLSPRELTHATTLHFTLRPLATPVVPAEPLAIPSVTEALPPQLAKPATETGTLPAWAESQPQLVLMPDDRQEVSWLRWDHAYRLRVDGQVRSVASLGELGPGTRRVQVDLDGRMLLDTLLTGQASHLLILPPRESFVEIRIRPPEAEVIGGSRSLGQGRCLIPRTDLPMQLRFPALPGLLPPKSLMVARDAPQVIELTHHERILLNWNPRDSQGLTLASRGYVMPGKTFVADPDHGPVIKGDRLLLGRAFQDRRPGGSHCARFTFDLPLDYDPEWPVELEVSAGDSGERFPLILTRGATLTVLLNGVSLAREITLESGLQRRVWPVSNLLQAGRNELLIQSSETARSRTEVRAMELRIGS